MSHAIHAVLAAVLKQRLPGFEAIGSCDKLTAGASQETYRIVATVNGGERRYALRRSLLEDVNSAVVSAVDLAGEARLLRVMNEAGIPAPEVILELQPQDELGRGFLMEWLEGETLGSRINRSGELALIRPRLARDCGEILARIHAVDWRAHGLDEVLKYQSAADLVRESWDHYREFDIPIPMIDFSARWLLANLPDEPAVTVVHGDFRNGNLMVTPQGINAVLDWEVAHLGDPVRDLGWLCVNSWRFGNTDKPVGGFGTVEELLAAYNTVAAIPVSAEQLHYWQVFGSFWWAVACLSMALSWRRGENTSVERPAIGRRSSEAQMDCVNLVIPGSFEIPAIDEAARARRELPLAEELLGGVAGFIEDEVAPDTSSRVKFLSRVAGNALAIVQRELALGPDLARAEHERLAALFGKEPGKNTGEGAALAELRWQLVHALRGELPLDTPGLADHLRQTVAGQLAIDQPRYGALRSPELP